MLEQQEPERQVPVRALQELERRQGRVQALQEPERQVPVRALQEPELQVQVRPEPEQGLPQARAQKLKVPKRR